MNLKKMCYRGELSSAFLQGSESINSGLLLLESSFESSLVMSVNRHVSHDVPTIQRVEGNPVIYSWTCTINLSDLGLGSTERSDEAEG